MSKHILFLGPAGVGKTVFWTMIHALLDKPMRLDYLEPMEIKDLIYRNLRYGKPLLTYYRAPGGLIKVLNNYTERLFRDRRWPPRTHLRELNEATLYIQFPMLEYDQNQELKIVKKERATLFPQDMPGEMLSELDELFDRRKVYALGTENIKKLRKKIVTVLKECLHMYKVQKPNKVSESQSLVMEVGEMEASKRTTELDNIRTIKTLIDTVLHPPDVIVIMIRANQVNKFDDKTLGCASRVIPYLLYSMALRKEVKYLFLITAAVADGLIDLNYAHSISKMSINDYFKEIRKIFFTRIACNMGALVFPLVNADIPKLNFCGGFIYDASVLVDEIRTPNGLETRPRFTEENKIRSFGLVTFLLYLLSITYSYSFISTTAGENSQIFIT